MEHNIEGRAYGVFIRSVTCPIETTIDFYVEKTRVCVVYRAFSWCIPVFLAMALLIVNAIGLCCGLKYALISNVAVGVQTLGVRE